MQKRWNLIFILVFLFHFDVYFHMVHVAQTIILEPKKIGLIIQFDDPKSNFGDRL